jgi:hypothetical protein
MHSPGRGRQVLRAVTIDPAVFIKPLQVTKRSRRVEASIIEWRCAAGEMGNPFADASDPIPVAAKAEF